MVISDTILVTCNLPHEIAAQFYLAVFSEAEQDPMSGAWRYSEMAGNATKSSRGAPKVIDYCVREDRLNGVLLTVTHLDLLRSVY